MEGGYSLDSHMKPVSKNRARSCGYGPRTPADPGKEDFRRICTALAPYLRRRKPGDSMVDGSRPNFPESNTWATTSRSIASRRKCASPSNLMGTR